MLCPKHVLAMFVLVVLLFTVSNRQVAAVGHPDRPLRVQYIARPPGSSHPLAVVVAVALQWQVELSVTQAQLQIWEQHCSPI